MVVVVIVVLSTVKSLPYWMAELMVSWPERVLYSIRPDDAPKKEAATVTVEVAATLRSVIELPVLTFMAEARVMVVAVESTISTRTPRRGALVVLLVKVTPALNLHPEIVCR